MFDKKNQQEKHVKEKNAESDFGDTLDIGRANVETNENVRDISEIDQQEGQMQNGTLGGNFDSSKEDESK